MPSGACASVARSSWDNRNEVKHVRTFPKKHAIRARAHLRKYARAGVAVRPHRVNGDLLDSLRGESRLALDDAQFGGLAFTFAEDKHPRPVLKKEFSLRLCEYLVSWPLLLDE